MTSVKRYLLGTLVVPGCARFGMRVRFAWGWRFAVCLRCEGGKNLVDGEWGLGYFGQREIAKRHLTGYSRDLSEGMIWQEMRSLSI